ncbi:protease modulator HflC [Gynuella sunshinyii]|uniref:Protein HflC n=1 Tax=Gynuella sunshinyii YC6258 TaxID=1445510 RepID=A0A0C5VJC4_9GAMM|nr:protease modulator HflC [Gynuella sunshinyii]AJQ94376.1 membrane protease subunit, stomatin/prohibitin-like protein [Gynuella sunshinyii YC6258]
MGNKSFFAVLIVLIAGLVLFNSVFIVSEKEKAVMLRFGEIAKADIPPGIHFKVPIMNTVTKFEGRVMNLDTRKERFITAEDQFLEVDSYVQWRIDNTRKYYQATSGGQKEVAMNVLANRVNDGLRSEFGKRTQNEVVSGERDQLTAIIKERVDTVAKEQLGIEVLDVRVKGIDLPQDVSENVFRQIRTAREKEAQEKRARGKEQAEIIKADADRQKIVLQANAYKEAEEIRGEGDAEAAKIYANAYSKDPEFYAFTRSLKAYEDTFTNGGDLMLLEPDSDFFRYLNNLKGAAK